MFAPPVDAVVQELRRIRYLLETLANPRPCETKTVLIPGRLTNEHLKGKLATARRLHADWEIEYIHRVTGAEATSEAPNGVYTLLFLRRPAFVQYPDDIATGFGVKGHTAGGPEGADGPPAPSEDGGLEEEGLDEEHIDVESEDAAPSDFSQPFLGVEEACKRFNVRRAAMMKAVRDGSLPSYKAPPKAREKGHPNPLGTPYAFQLRLDDVERWVKDVYSELPPPRIGRPPKKR